MNETHLDPLVLGRRIRHHRKRLGMTLEELGEQVSKPGPYLSLLENGKKEPRLNLVMMLAGVLDVPMSDLIDPNPPTVRDGLEIDVLRFQDSSLFDSLDLPPVRPGARMDTGTLAHIAGLHRALRDKSALGALGSAEVRRANSEVTRRLTENDGYLEAVEAAAAEALRNSGYSGEGPFSSRNLLDLTDRTGFEIRPIDDMPSFARAVTDLKNRRIYIAQRNELRTRQARKAVVQTLAGFLLGHEADPDLDTFLQQRMESAYFATAVLAPEEAVLPRIQAAKVDHDIDVEDVKELFYVSYEMAAWRTVNLLTRHFDIPSHLLVTDHMGSVVKGYTNDGVSVPRDDKGGIETQRLCRNWSARVTFDSAERFGTHRQYTDTPTGTYFCTTHIEAGREPAHAITVGVKFGDARWFRGRDTEARRQSTCPDPSCCRVPPEDLQERWANQVIVSARSQARILGMLAPDPYPELDMPEVLEMVEAQAPTNA